MYIYIFSYENLVTKIYVCTTMWHESEHEMMYMLQSIFRMDEDQCSRRNAQKYLKFIDPDYYEFEAHIFFDDAFTINSSGHIVLNKYVNNLIKKLEEAARCIYSIVYVYILYNFRSIYQTNINIRDCKKYSVPYGGRLSYILPGNNSLTIHLKDKNKIRQRKRWSQVYNIFFILPFLQSKKN